MNTTFVAFMASMVHELKNGLGTLIAGLEKIYDESQSLTIEERKQIERLQRMAFQINNGLMELLCFYKVENQQYPLRMSDHSVKEFLEEQLIYMRPFVEERALALSAVCDETLEARFDAPLMTAVLRDAMTNACRFAKKQVVCRAFLKEKGILFQVEDDGKGYPPEMLGKLTEKPVGVDFQTGSTGLGLFFAQEVAKLHQEGQRVAELLLENKGVLGGACFNFWIPL